MPTELRSFLALSYDELEDLNLRSKEQRKNRLPLDDVREERLKYLTDEKRIKAVTHSSSGWGSISNRKSPSAGLRFAFSFIVSAM